MSMAQDFLDKLQAGRVETKVATESIYPWTRLNAVLENNRDQPSEYEKLIESPAPTLGNATPELAPAVSVKKTMQQPPTQQQPVQQTPQQPPPAEPSEEEQLKKYETIIDKIFDRKNFGKLVAPTIRNSIRKTLKEQLPDLDYKNLEFIEKFEEANELVTKVASKIAGEFEGVLNGYKAAIQELAGIEAETVLSEE